MINPKIKILFEDVSNAVKDIETSILSCQAAIENELITDLAREKAKQSLPKHKKKRDRLAQKTVDKVRKHVQKNSHKEFHISRFSKHFALIFFCFL